MGGSKASGSGAETCWSSREEVRKVPGGWEKMQIEFFYSERTWPQVISGPHSDFDKLEDSCGFLMSRLKGNETSYEF